MYTKDIFISYAHIDNQPLAADKSGWISRFHASLHALLSMRLGKDARIWRDDKLQGNDRFAEEIVGQFDSTAALVSVVSPRYLRSEWCTREVDEFCQRACKSKGLYIDKKARVFKILKTPIDDETALPAVMRELLGYEFFTLEDGVPMELDDVFGEKYGQDFNRKVNKLAFEIADLLTSINSPESRLDSRQRPTIYLANCSFDVKEEREKIETEISRLGYVVLPDRHLPTDEVAYCKAVQHKLAQSALSIHLVGQHYGAVADGPSQKSQSVLQNELAAEQCRTSDLKRILWVPSDIVAQQAQQQSFIDALHTDKNSQLGADLVTGNIEMLKQVIFNTLESMERSPEPPTKNPPTDPPTVPPPSEEKKLYLICTEADLTDTVPLRKYFRNAGFTVSIPAFKGDATQVRKINQHSLENSNLVIVFYGGADDAWKRSIDVELQKLPVYLAGKPAPLTYTYLADPPSADKDDLLNMEEPNLINGLQGLDIPALTQCLSETRQSENVA